LKYHPKNNESGAPLSRCAAFVTGMYQLVQNRSAVLAVRDGGTG
jgi:hypothetical protein